MEIITNSAQKTKEFAGRFAKGLKPADTLALYGNLGSGKTTFVQGLAAALGYKGRVLSPTFVFVRPYRLENGGQRTGKREKAKIKTLFHIDLYRLEGVDSVKTIGIEEFLLDRQAISAIEWPEKIENLLPKSTKKIYFEKLQGTRRKISVI